MAFYVPLGPRGLLFRVGTMIVGVSGGLVYWWASRRRSLAPMVQAEPFALGDA